MPFSPKWVAMTVACLALFSCGEPTDDKQANTLVQNAAEPRPLPVAEPPLDRAALLVAALRAASAHAAGMDDGAAQRQLDGKRFEVRLRFGCAGGGAQDETRGSRFDVAKRTLRLRVANDISPDDAVVAGIAADDFETVEGLWLRRPWLLMAACVRAAPQAPVPVAATNEPGRDAQETPAAEPEAVSSMRRVGIAQFFTAADPRTARRQERPYEATAVLDEGQQPSEQGYDFVLSGRLRALPDRRVIACWSASAEVAPDCIISVRVDRAWIERSDNRELVAEWHGN